MATEALSARVLPLAKLWQELSAHWRVEFGWELPEHFGDWQREYDAAVHAAAVFDLSYRTTIHLLGRDRISFLHNFCTNDILRTPVGQGCEAFLTTAQAKVLAWFHAFVGKDAVVLDADADRGPAMVQHLSRYQISEDVTFEDRTGQWAILHVCGAKARESVVAVIGLPDLPQAEHEHLLTHVQGQEMHVRRLSRFGLPGWDLVSPPAIAAEIMAALLKNGLPPAGMQAAEVLRVENGWPIFGRDYDETNLPQELARDDRAISFTKGCYLGQETVARIRAYGHVNRLLCGLRFAENRLPGPGTPLYPATPAGSAATGGVSPTAVRTATTGEIGRVTSPVISPRYGAIALGWLRRGYWQPGTCVLANTPTGPVSATVSSLPFIAPTAPEPSSR